jgi:predicted nucleic acid-binding protein
LILLDTSGLVTFFVKAQPAHTAVVAALEAERPPLVISPFVLAEVDYLLATRGGTGVELTALHELAAGAYDLAEFGHADLVAALDVLQRYADLGIGLTDASIVVLAERLGTRRVLTLDRRHFGALRTSGGEAFELFP